MVIYANKVIQFTFLGKITFPYVCNFTSDFQKNCFKRCARLERKKSANGGAPSVCVPEQSEKLRRGGGIMAPGLIRVKTEKGQISEGKGHLLERKRDHVSK